MVDLALFPRPGADPVAAGDLHRRLDELHQMIYRRGGIRPVNAAIEELTKLLLMELKLAEDPSAEVPGVGRLAEVLDLDAVTARADVDDVKAAFRYIASLPEYAGRMPDGGRQPIWPDDEPLRISRPDVVAEALRLLREHLAESQRGRYDVIGTAFDIFLRGRYDHSGGLGTHLTPHNVAAMLARICMSELELRDDQPDHPIIGDPCCGTGRFLIAAVGELPFERDDPRRASLLEHGLFGADQSTSSVAKARINLLLLGARHPNVFTVGDSITDASVDALRGKLRLILTNPPFGDGKYDSVEGTRRTGRLLPVLAGKRRIDPALAFLVRCLDLLADRGRLGIILPDGLVDGPVLRRALLGNSSVRLRDVSVEANVSLPTATFALAGTVARTSALVLRRQHRQRSHVFLARAEHVGYLKQGSTSVPDRCGDDLPLIARAATSVLARNVSDADGGVQFLSRAPLAAVVAARELTTLDPSRLDPGAVSARMELRVAGVAFRDLLRPTKRRQRASGSAIPHVSVLHIDDLGAIAWHEAREYRPSTPGLAACPGDVIFSLLNPRKLRAAVVPPEIGPVHCSSEFGVFEALGDPYEVLVLLHHPLVRAQLAPLGRGTSSSRRRISEADLLDVRAPLLDADELAALADQTRRSLDRLREASIAVSDAYATASSAVRA